MNNERTNHERHFDEQIAIPDADRDAPGDQRIYLK